MTAQPSEPTARLGLDDSTRQNALSSMVVADLRRQLHTAVLTGARLLVIESSARAFCAGLDLSRVLDGGAAELARTLRQVLGLIEDLQSAPLTTISVVGGAARGAGADLAIAADLRIGTRQASFAFPGARFGLLLGSHRLAHRIGPAAAHELIRTGRVSRADEALELGLLNHLTDHPQDLLSTITADLLALPAGTGQRLSGALRPDCARADRDLLEASLADPGLFARFSDFAGARGFAPATDHDRVPSPSKERS